jgi:hypothetical protein
MKKIATALLMAGFSLSALAQNLDKPILGLMLGKKLDRSFPNCERGQKTPADYCSLGSAVNAAKPGNSASLHLWGDKKRFELPSWIMYQRPIAIRFTKSGEVGEISAFTNGVKSQNEVNSAVAERFGKPVSVNVRDVQNGFGAKFQLVSTTWASPNIVIRSGCINLEDCYLEFLTPDYDASRTAAREASQKKDKL